MINNLYPTSTCNNYVMFSGGTYIQSRQVVQIKVPQNKKNVHYYVSTASIERTRCTLSVIFPTSYSLFVYVLAVPSLLPFANFKIVFILVL